MFTGPASTPPVTAESRHPTVIHVTDDACGSTPCDPPWATLVRESQRALIASRAQLVVLGDQEREPRPADCQGLALPSCYAHGPSGWPGRRYSCPGDRLSDRVRGWAGHAQPDGAAAR